MPVRLAVLALIALIALVVPPAGAAEPAMPSAIELSSLDGDVSLLGRALFLIEPDGPLSVEEALRSAGWQMATERTRKRGLTSATTWMRFAIVNDTGRQQEVVVTHDVMRLTTFTVYAIAPDGRVQRGDYDQMQPYDERPLAYAGPALAITVPAGEGREVAVRFGNDHPIPIHLDLMLWSERGFEHHSVTNTAFFVFWIGCLATAASFWLLYGIFMRQARMIVYAVYMSAVASTYVIFSGVGLQLLFPSNAWLQHIGFDWSVFLLTAAAYEFARRHLDLAHLHPRHNVVLRVAVGFYGTATLLALPAQVPVIETPLTFIALMTMPFHMTWLSWVAWRRDGLKYASWMALGWGLVSVSTLLTACVTASFVPFLAISHIILVRLVFIGIVLESLLLSASLGQWLRGQEVRRIAAETAASRDALTGLLNRRGFDAKVADLKQDGKWPGTLWLALIDLDRFKDINDTYSHAAGDAVLTHFASMLRREFRATDVTARFGGEEFMLLFEAETEAAARSVADRVRRRFADTPTRFGGAAIGHTLSAGLVRVGESADEEEATLIAMADTALYAAKKAGRNAVCAYSDLADMHGRDVPTPGTVVRLAPLVEPVTARS
ncbi:diguanylate cyclase [Thalassobaculum sp. OXR-137]|uniref:sensor domain-containing diguanylate cyclase n=1 Tax=Thalassobaculum sp. OXR-137 TaxID=3100173 RepID=UPI002AC915C7|nr:diguanylate cyclase [Thalassobaculum sp. OXR-137]WPZ37003.1 diguanylate cyclase [Thalassobaculum sp. OXR-137]